MTRGLLRRISFYGRPSTLGSVREIAISFAELVEYFVGRGVLFGVNLKLDPSDHRSRRAVGFLASLGGLVALIVAPAELSAGIVLTLAPLALYALPSGMSDRIMENRAYLSTFGVGIIGAWAAERAIVPVAILGALYAIATVRRNPVWRSRTAFRKRAFLESPTSVRARTNYAIALTSEGKLDEAIAMYEGLVLRGEGTFRERGLVIGNLAYRYLDRFEATADDAWVKRAAELLDGATGELGKHSLVRFARGHMFMGYGLWNQAVVELTEAVKAAPGSTLALRHRAICWGRLGCADLAKADLALAEAKDGMPGRLIFADADDPMTLTA